MSKTSEKGATEPTTDEYAGAQTKGRDDYRSNIHRSGDENTVGAAINLNDPSKVPAGFIPGQPPETQTQNETAEPLAGQPVPGYVSAAEFTANAEGLTLEEKQSGVKIEDKQEPFVSPDEQKAQDTTTTAAPESD
jgi:hypothetical protein